MGYAKNVSSAQLINSQSNLRDGMNVRDDLHQMQVPGTKAAMNRTTHSWHFFPYCNLGVTIISTQEVYSAARACIQYPLLSSTVILIYHQSIKMALDQYTYVFAIGTFFALLDAYNNGASKYPFIWSCEYRSSH